MSCYHPYVAVAEKKPLSNEYIYTKNNKIKYKFLHKINPEDIRTDIKKQELIEMLSDKYDSRDIIFLPCGQCIGCRLQYSREWANRLMLERQYHTSAIFLTLTYDDFHVPERCFVLPDSGEVGYSLSLRKRDIQLFMKRLRKHFSEDHIRFYAAGEYGTHTFRPHYHLIIFGIHVDDSYVWRVKMVEGQRFCYYRSPTLEFLWPYGHVEFSDVSWDTCAYVARYVTKKLTGDCAEFYDTFNIDPPFSLMSRKPGIGRQYYDEHLTTLFDYDTINLGTEKGGLSFRHPSYYKRLYESDFSDSYVQYAETQRIMQRRSTALRVSLQELTYGQMLEQSERIMQAKLDKKLPRKEI